MGNFDITTKNYINDPIVFADICNYILYEGKQVINPNNLTEKSISEFVILNKNNSNYSKAIEKFRDNIKNVTIMDDDNATYLLFGIENQTNIHYAMPVRNMLYDALNYSAQVDDTAKHNNDNKESDREFLTGLKPTDKIKPVITVTIYFGYDDWNGPRSLYDMFPEDTPKQILQYVNDYPINIIVPSEINDFSKFKSDLGVLLELIKNVNNASALSETLNKSNKLSRNALYVFKNFSNAIKINKKVGDNMITPEIEKEYEIFYGKKARIAGIAEGKAEGRAEGKAEGRAESKAEDLVLFTDNLAKTVGYEKAYELLEISEEEYNQAKQFLEQCKNSDSE